MKNFIIVVIKVITGEVILVILLLICMLQVKNNSKISPSHETAVLINGEFDSKTITVVEEIEMGRVKYGEERSITLSLKATCDSCYIDTILTECSCTKVHIESNRLYNRGDTAFIHISMQGVEYGRQIRRIHILPQNSRANEAKSITLLADVE